MSCKLMTTFLKILKSLLAENTQENGTSPEGFVWETRVGKNGVL
jgi:hypothetical protein